MISDPAALVAELGDPTTSGQRLTEIAGSFPEYGPMVAEHPAASVEVLAYLLKHGNEATRKAAARRRARDVALIASGQAPRTETTVSTEVLRESAGLDTPSAPITQSLDSAAVTGGFRKAPQLDDEVDQTVISTRAARTTAWSLVVNGEVAHTITATEVLLGRKPQAHPGYSAAEPLAIEDTTKTVSKTHARLILRGESWMIVDLGSTNGVIVVDAGQEQKIAPGAEIEIVADFFLGDLKIRLEPKA